MTHALTCWCRDACNKANHRLFHVLFGPQCSVDFVRSADFADHDDGIGVGVVVKQLEHINVLQAIDWIATDTNSTRLT